MPHGLVTARHLQSRAGRSRLLLGDPGKRLLYDIWGTGHELRLWFWCWYRLLLPLLLYVLTLLE